MLQLESAAPTLIQAATLTLTLSPTLGPQTDPIPQTNPNCRTLTLALTQEHYFTPTKAGRESRKA